MARPGADKVVGTAALDGDAILKAPSRVTDVAALLRAKAEVQALLDGFDILPTSPVIKAALPPRMVTFADLAGGPGGGHHDDGNAHGGAVSGSDRAWVDRFYQSVGAVSTLGASITFALVVSDIKDPAEASAPPEPYFDGSTVRIFLATGWLLFSLGLGSSFFLAGWLKAAEGDSKKWNRMEEWFSTILYTLVLGAFMMLSLAVVAYVQVVGWIAVGFTAAFGLYIAIFQVASSIWKELKQPVKGSGAGGLEGG